MELPILNYKDAKETYQILHLLTQIIGKIKLTKSPWINHSWHVTLILTPTGFTTLDIPDKSGHFQIEIDFYKNRISINTDKGIEKTIPLKSVSISEYYFLIKQNLLELGIEINIRTTPNEIPNSVPFEEDKIKRIYNSDIALKFHLALLASEKIFNKFRSEFIGKSSPVHFFWGSFDLAVSRFSGKKAPRHPGGVPNLPDWVAQEAYSHEVYSCGFWPGNEMVPYAAFYAYIYPEPDGFRNAKNLPAQAFYHPELSEYIFPYEAFQSSSDPENILLQFLHSTYEAAATFANWNRSDLEKNIIKTI